MYRAKVLFTEQKSKFKIQSSSSKSQVQSGIKVVAQGVDSGPMRKARLQSRDSFVAFLPYEVKMKQTRGSVVGNKGETLLGDKFALPVNHPSVPLLALAMQYCWRSIERTALRGDTFWPMHITAPIRYTSHVWSLVRYYDYTRASCPACKVR